MDESTMILIGVVIGIIHIILTIAVYKMKGGPYACFYFFLAPLAIVVLFLFLGRDNSEHHHHHFH
jgi:hypothetical protein